MNTYVTVALLAILGLSQANPVGHYGYGSPWVGHAPLYYPSAVSTANLVKAAPISVIKTQVVPIVTAPLYNYGYNLGYKGLGWGGYDGLGWGGYGSWVGHGGYGGHGNYGGLGNYGGWGYKH